MSPEQADALLRTLTARTMPELYRDRAQCVDYLAHPTLLPDQHAEARVWLSLVNSEIAARHGNE